MLRNIRTGWNERGVAWCARMGREAVFTQKKEAPYDEERQIG